RLAGPARDAEPPDRFTLAKDQIPARVLVVLVVVAVLSLELHAEELRLLGFGPVDERHLQLACAGVDLREEGLVLGSRRPQADHRLLRRVPHRQLFGSHSVSSPERWMLQARCARACRSFSRAVERCPVARY